MIYQDVELNAVADAEAKLHVVKITFGDVMHMNILKSEPVTIKTMPPYL